MKKRLLAGILSALALWALCACSAQTPAPANSAEPAETLEPADPAQTSDESESTLEAPALTIQDMIDANAEETLAQTYGSMRADYERDEWDTYTLKMLYADAELSYRDFSAAQEVYYRDGGGYYHDGEDYGAILDFDDGPTYFTLDAELTVMEEIVGVEETPEGLVVTTRLSTEALRPYYDADSFPYAEGDSFEEIYTLNPDDYALLKNVSAIVHADGTRTTQDTTIVTYGVERPEGVTELAERRNAEDIRTGTVTLAPGTPDERTASATARKGDYISVSVPAGYGPLCTDPECTVVSPEEEEPDLSADFTLYAAKVDG